MNTMLFDFYRGVGKDNLGRNFSDMLKMTDLQLERSHDVIQWLFPLKEISKHNRAAPLLDEETIAAIKNDKDCLRNLYGAGLRMMIFFVQITSVEGVDRFGRITKMDIPVERPTWITKNNHNFLRLTRIIKCYNLLGDENMAITFYDLAMKYYKKFPEIIGDNTVKFWSEAVDNNNIVKLWEEVV